MSVAAGLVHLLAVSAAFSPATSTRSTFTLTRLRAPSPTLQGSRGSEFSAAERAAARAARAAGGHAPTAMPAAQAPAVPQPSIPHSAPQPGAPRTGAPPAQLDVDSVVAVLLEFVQSDYARQQCNYVNAAPTDYGTIEGMFDKVEISDAKLMLKLSRSFEQRSTSILDKLTRHLRTRMPQVESLEYQQGSTIRTIFV